VVGAGSAYETLPELIDAAPEIVERFRTVGYDPLPLDAPGMTKMIALEARIWRDVIRSGQIDLIE
jgi:hypothetical protein